MVNIKSFSKIIFGSSTFCTCVILLCAYYFAYLSPALSMLGPTSLPGWTIITTPVIGFPLTKTIAITKELILPSLFSTCVFLFFNFNIFSAIRTTHFFRCGTVGPSRFESVFSSTRIITEISFKYAVWLKKNVLSAISTIRFHVIGLAYWVYPCKIFTSTFRTTKSTVFCRLRKKVFFYHEFFLALSAIYFYS